MPAPAQPKIYHITHVDNLPSIIASGALYSDARMIRGGAPLAQIGMSSIKRRRLGLPVTCHPGDMVGDYVPFYFCPRSVMLYVIHCANHDELAYRGEQDPIVHLELDLHQVVAWANAQPCRWAFSLSNAGAVYTEFRNSLANLSDLNWAAIFARDWRNPDVKEAKQAEFLVHDTCPWHLVSQVGARTMATKVRADAAIAQAGHKPPVRPIPAWYY
jgi:hypothetical protein